MKALCASLVVAGLVVLSGCNTSSSGGSSEAGTFKLKGPSNTPETTVKRGEPVTKDITVDADKNFKQEITFEVTVEPADKDVTASVEPKVWKGSENKKVELHIKAGDKADKGEYTIHVKGKPAKGDATEVTVKVKVPEKK